MFLINNYNLIYHYYLYISYFLSTYDNICSTEHFENPLAS